MERKDLIAHMQMILSELEEVSEKATNWKLRDDERLMMMGNAVDGTARRLEKILEACEK